MHCRTDRVISLLFVAAMGFSAAIIVLYARQGVRKNFQLERFSSSLNPDFEVAFSVSNTSKSTEVINSFLTSCDCTAVVPDNLVLAPGQVADVTAKINLLKFLAAESRRPQVEFSIYPLGSKTIPKILIQGTVHVDFRWEPEVRLVELNEVSLDPVQLDFDCLEPMESVKVFWKNSVETVAEFQNVEGTVVFQLDCKELLHRMDQSNQLAIHGTTSSGRELEPSYMPLKLIAQPPFKLYPTSAFSAMSESTLNFSIDNCSWELVDIVGEGICVHSWGARRNLDSISTRCTVGPTISKSGEAKLKFKLNDPSGSRSLELVASISQTEF